MTKKLVYKIDLFTGGKRIDAFLASNVEDISRQFAQKLIADEMVLVNGKSVKSGYKLKEGDRLTVEVPPLKHLEIKPKRMPLDILYEDKNVIVINKSCGVVVHPGVDGTHANDSLVNGLLFHCKKSLSGINGVLRPGIVHRLDKDTSGVMICAKNDKSHKFLAEQFEDRQVEKVYYALVAGCPNAVNGMIDSPIGRSGGDRKKMSVTSEKRGKYAVTKYQVVKRFEIDEITGSDTKDCCLMEVRILTGRTHQIRVHLSAIGYPIIGDTVYGDQTVNTFFEQAYGLERIFLHAGLLKLVLPDKKRQSAFEAELPDDLKQTLSLLEK